MFIINTPEGPVDLDDPQTGQENHNRMMERTMNNEQINEALRQLNLPDGDEDTEHPDTQYSDFDSAGDTATITFLPGLTADDLDYWYNRAQEISNEFFQGLPVTFVPKA